MSQPPRLGSRYGVCDGRTAFARETEVGHWQVKVYDPKSPTAAYDGWVLLGTDWLTLDDAVAETGLA